MSVLVERLLAVHDSLSRAGLPHAFGGAIALAYCTEEPRGTRDLDVNIFADAAFAEKALRSLPDEVAVSDVDIAITKRDGQTRVWWDDTPIDVFLNNHPFHGEVAKGVRWVPLGGQDIPVLGCAALAVFKALFNRTKDWADIEAMAEAGGGDLRDAQSWVAELLGPDDPIVAKLAELVPGVAGESG
ncbi:MAG TPA: hypothetical protein VGO97_03870 [Solirubrobacterales bacterium]|jgi:hypothetical protein|nr:hypothetical protein [Solirubrobacterales bacterium]